MRDAARDREGETSTATSEPSTGSPATLSVRDMVVWWRGRTKGKGCATVDKPINMSQRGTRARGLHELTDDKHQPDNAAGHSARLSAAISSGLLRFRGAHAHHTPPGLLLHSRRADNGAPPDCQGSRSGFFSTPSLSSMRRPATGKQHQLRLIQDLV